MAWQGAGTDAMLAVFDVVRTKHEGMDAASFNNDADYKERLNSVRG